ncbi:hypothetical protein QBC42DRAFT_247860 [Cladorrhinum samala]|uniref:Uncharacterized protein n=1 Tax=Cladorrhinum samala TaxID=585594 RepID=A0AAV9I378_9PEZI|nr:hypothetical protein QBC42DRAFT_247860 [Cladorrhinum samala]
MENVHPWDLVIDYSMNFETDYYPEIALEFQIPPLVDNYLHIGAAPDEVWNEATYKALLSRPASSEEQFYLAIAVEILMRGTGPWQAMIGLCMLLAPEYTRNRNFHPTRQETGCRSRCWVDTIACWKAHGVVRGDYSRPWRPPSGPAFFRPMECRILLRVADEEAKDLMMKGSLAEFHNIDRRVGPSLRFIDDGEEIEFESQIFRMLGMLVNQLECHPADVSDIAWQTSDEYDSGTF